MISSATGEGGGMKVFVVHDAKIHLWLKNTGTVPANYYLHMSVVQD